MPKRSIITIDGLAGVGKTTVSKELAKLLGYTYISTGWFYRCLAAKILKEKIGTHDERRISQAAEVIKIEVMQDRDNTRILCDGEDVTKSIATPLIVSTTSEVSVYPGVRKALLAAQRSYGKNGGIVVEGRDAGTVVYPSAEWKFYIQAAFEMRRKRLFKLLSPEERAEYKTPESLTEQLKEIDKRDLGREAAPTRIPDDAIIYDNSDSPLPFQDAVVLYYYITHTDEIIKNVKKFS